MRNLEVLDVVQQEQTLARTKPVGPLDGAIRQVPQPVEKKVDAVVPFFVRRPQG